MTTSIDKLRILYIVPYFDPAWAYGGSVRAAYELTWRLAERGHEVLVYTTDALDAEQRAPAGDHIIRGIKVRRKKAVSNKLSWERLFLTAGFDLPGLMKEFDFVHLQEARTLQNIYALPVLRRYNLPYVIMPQGSFPIELRRTGAKRIYDWLFGNQLFDSASRLHALTEMERQQYIAAGLPEHKIMVLPNGSEINTFDMDVDVGAFKRKYNVPEDRPVIGFFARINPIKGPEFLADSFAMVLKQRPDAILLMCGPDDGALSSFEQRIKQLGIQGSVRYTGFIGGDQEKAAAYRSFDVYVLPSRYEIQGITIFEALLNRTPCITTDRCGLAIPMSAANVLDTVTFGDTEDFASKMLGAIEQPDIAQQRAERGRKYVIENYNWDKITDLWIDVYRQCIEEKSMSHG